MEAKHTPGPWRLETTEPTANVCGSVKVSVGDWPWRATLYGGEDAESDAVTRADANLMVAAPELLAACEFVMKFAAMRAEQSNPLPGQLTAAVSAAIAKATGQSR